jgi:hypothetical protein
MLTTIGNYGIFILNSMIKLAHTLALLILTSTILFGQENTQNHDTIEVKVRLTTILDSIQLPPYCGTVAWDMTFEFEILEVLSGDYSDKTIRINIQCPLEAVQNKFLETGGEYQYRLVKRYGVKEINIGEMYKEQELDDYERVY